MASAAPLDEYSEIADQQLDTLERSSGARLYNAIIGVCGEILDNPSELRKFSSVLTTTEGLRFSTPIPGEYPYKVFWSMPEEGLGQIEAVFPYDVFLLISDPSPIVKNNANNPPR